MPEPLTIGLEMTGVDKIAAVFNALAKSTDDTTARMTALTVALNTATDAYKALNAEAEKYNRMSGGGPAINIGRGMTPQGGSNSPASQRFTSGPFQRQEKLAQEMSRAMAQGNARAVADVGLAQARNDKAVARASGGSRGLGDKFLDTLKTSRFSLAGGKAEIMPLVGKTLGVITEALGPELAAVAGPVGAVAAASVSAAKAIFDLAKASAEAGAAYARFTYAIGNNGPGAAKAQAVGRAGGLSPEQTASLAESLNSAITGSAMGRSFGLRVGVFNQGGAYGNVDKATQLTQAIEGLRNIKSFDERVRTMNMLGLQGASQAVMASDKQFNLSKGDAAATSQIMDPEFQQKSVDFQAALGRVGDAFDRLMVVLGKPSMADITTVMNNIANGLNNFALVLTSPAMQATLKILGAVASPASVFAAATKGDDPHTTAQKETTAAIKEQTALMKTPGVYGRDTDGRLGRAMGSGVGFNADSRARADDMRVGYAMGAF